MKPLFPGHHKQMHRTSWPPGDLRPLPHISLISHHVQIPIKTSCRGQLAF